MRLPVTRATTTSEVRHAVGPRSVALPGRTRAGETWICGAGAGADGAAMGTGSGGATTGAFVNVHRTHSRKWALTSTVPVARSVETSLAGFSGELGPGGSAKLPLVPCV